jgi:polyferredoxin
MMQNTNTNTVEQNHNLSLLNKIYLAVMSIGFLILLIVLTGITNNAPLFTFYISFGMIVFGSTAYIIAKAKASSPGIKNDHVFFDSVTSRGIYGWILGVIFTGFYVVLYWYPLYLENWIRLVDPLAYLIMKQSADQWFLYGTVYTLSVLVMGLRMIVYKYRHNRYHQIRTASIMFFQLGFAFLIPFILKGLNQPDFYFSYFWPLKYDYLFPGNVNYLLSHPGGLGFFMIFWGSVMTFVATPVLTYFFGKRWYCSWVCGCGGLANTLGDPFRQLSDKSLRAWKIERWSIHSVLVLVLVTTVVLWINSVTEGAILGQLSNSLSKFYGFSIGALFSGVIGVGFYPVLGSRVWCRFGCPLAAIMGIQQKFLSKFRITTNGGQCISCGNCSTYCEMGIDVRWYAQRAQNIIRASCVGCGVCAAVCPRGVLKLENGHPENRYYQIEDYNKTELATEN